jgi:hypothetical protein
LNHYSGNIFNYTHHVPNVAERERILRHWSEIEEVEPFQLLHLFETEAANKRQSKVFARHAMDCELGGHISSALNYCRQAASYGNQIAINNLFRLEALMRQNFVHGP